MQVNWSVNGPLSQILYLYLDINTFFPYHVFILNSAQGFQQPQATLNSAPMSTSQVTQAQQTISLPPSQDYSHCEDRTIQEQQSIHSENGQTDAVLSEHTGMYCDINLTVLYSQLSFSLLYDVTLHGVLLSSSAN